jgi:hypothetical protein
MTAGGVYAIAGTGSRGFSGDGGPATSATLDFRAGTAVAVDSAGNVAVADSGNTRVRLVAARTGSFYGQSMTAGDIYTIAGNGAGGIGFGFSGDGGAATKAEFYALGVAGNPAGDLARRCTGSAGFGGLPGEARSGTDYSGSGAGPASHPSTHWQSPPCYGLSRKPPTDAPPSISQSQRTPDCPFVSVLDARPGW